MAKPRRSIAPRTAESDRPAVTAERFARLYRLVELLSGKPLSREVLARRLGVDVRGFYRDLGLIRKAGLSITIAEGRYALAEELEDALGRLPFPDPLLTLGEARLLAKGRSAAHRRVQEQLEHLTAR